MAPPGLKVELTPEEDITLFELRTAAGIPQRTKDRAEALRLNHRGWSCGQIAEYFNWQVATVRHAIHRWQDKGLYGLWDEPRSGRPRGWQEADLDYLEEVIEQDPRTFNSRQLVQQLADHRDVHLSRRHLRRVLKKRATAGSAPATATVTCMIRLKKPVNKPI